MNTLRTDEFDYHLPTESIAQDAIEPRDAAKMLCYQLSDGQHTHKHVSDLCSMLHPDDLLVFNTTKVFPARLFGTKDSGGKVEVLLIHPLENTPQENTTIQRTDWRCFIRGSVRIGTIIHIADQAIEVSACHENGERDISFADDCDVMALCDAHGHVPLPPYIKRNDTAHDRERYQSVFAQDSGSVAAPTASLHFTKQLLQHIDDMGIATSSVQLHIGPGTFKPVTTDFVKDYTIHKEFCICPQACVDAIAACRKRGGRVIAIGTTVVRTLETAARQKEGFAAHQSWSQLYLYPPQKLLIVDGMLTNFHLPKSSLLMLVSCLCGRENLLNSYQIAKENNYRFYSYGDAMLLL